MLRLRAALRLAISLLLFAIAGAFCVQVHAAEPDGALRFRLVVEAPGALKGILADNLELARWQSYENLTPELLDSLIANARDEARDIAATEGFFSARVEARVEGDGSERVVRVTVEPGNPVRVRKVTIGFRDEPDQRLADRVRARWALPAGEVFRQGAWEAAKKNALEILGDERYAAAAITESRATVDPEAGSADLEVALAHGPVFAFGPVTVKGLSRYPPETVLNLAPFRAGEPYSREKVDVYVRRLTATGYFASAQVAVDRNPELAGAAPVQVAVIEGPTRRLDGTLGYSTDAKYRSSIGWRDVDLLDSGIRLSAEARLESQVQGLTGSLQFPADASGWANSLDANVGRTDVQKLVTRGITLGVTRRSLDERRQPSYGASYYYEEQEPSGAPRDTAYATFARYEYTRRTVDDLLFPRSGMVAALKLGVGLPGVSSRTFGRAVTQLAWYHPFSRRDDFLLRGEVGAVIADSAQGIPQALLFRTGGDTTVRGYDYQSLGPKKGDAVVGGRYYTVASAEYTHWFSDSWGTAAFVDAGNAVDVLSDFRLAIGVGLGVRIRSPVGPFRLDLAYGRDTNEFRVHFSVGIAF
jgi:translocation and assembly module TamA